MLSRNTPVAFVVGAAGFLGSHLVEKLLDKGIQVVGVDDLSSGSLENLEDAVKNKKFHLFNQTANLDLPQDFPRLDYAFFLITDTIPQSEYLLAFGKFLERCQKFKARIVLVSSIEFYDNQKEVESSLREAEKNLAKFSLDHKINARVVRLSTIYGPRMKLGSENPVTRLIKSAAKGELQKESTPLDFTTRDLYIDDAVTLLIKAVMHGSTAQKIYDGALRYPVKVSEIKQVLLDPVWHENQGFVPTQLPPWPTPNLEKTEKELLWKPQKNVIEALKLTLNFFRDHPELIDTAPSIPKNPPKELGEKEILLEEFRTGKKTESPNLKKEILAEKNSETFKKAKRVAGIFLGVALITYALIIPLTTLVIGVIGVKEHIKNSTQQAAAGNFDLAKNEAEKAREGVGEMEGVLKSLAVAREIGILQSQFQAADQLLQLLDKTTEAIQSSIEGTQMLSEGMKIISGENDGDLPTLLGDASLKLSQADRDLGFVSGRLDDDKFMEIVPGQLQGRVEDLKSKVNFYQQVVGYGRSLSFILPQVIALDGRKSYLILLQDNTTLKPTGGQLVSYAQITFDHGKLMEVKADDVANLDKNLTEHVDPPTELKKDLGVNNWSLADSNFEADFPTSAHTASWFYQKEGGERVSGVVALDLNAAAKLIELTGPLNLSSPKETIDSNQFTDKVMAQGKGENILTPVLKELVNRMFFLTKQNWPQLSQTLNEQFGQKHFMVYLADPALFSYLISQNWVGAIPRQVKEGAGERNEFLAVSEANMGSDRANYYIQRNIELKSTIDSNFNVTHQLVISYNNQSPSNDWPGGIYRDRVKIYLAGGSQLTKASWGDEDITTKVSPFADFGRAGYSTLIELAPKEQKKLVLAYKDFRSFKLDGNNLKYQLRVIKQPGTDKDNFSFTLNYPPSLTGTLGADPNGDSHEISFNTDLSFDRSFEINLQKAK
ncbi:MAG: DUF4012 domain-containing protein [Patescibacteria group bacterium]|nr:DUF4012 domain-containing protein [Patescibacteria group bacterium]